MRPIERLVLAAAAVANRYSELEDDETDEYTVADGVDLSVGGEYVLFLGPTPLALRLGVQRFASSNEYYDGSDPDQQEWFPREDPILAFGLGVGVVLGSRFQLDVGAMGSDAKSEGVFSLVYRLSRAPEAVHVPARAATLVSRSSGGRHPP